MSRNFPSKSIWGITRDSRQKELRVQRRMCKVIEEHGDMGKHQLELMHETLQVGRNEARKVQGPYMPCYEDLTSSHRYQKHKSF